MKVLSVRQVGRQMKAGQVYIGRPSKWGNPYVVGRDGARGECVAKYKRYLWERVKREGDGWLRELVGNDLVCWCKEDGREVACHGDVIKAYLEWRAMEDAKAEARIRQWQ